MTLVVRAALVASAAFACLAHTGAAQQQQPATLSGHVTTASAAPLGQATVLVQQLNAGATTRSDGSYTLAIPGARVPSGPVTVAARAVGYKPSIARVTITAGTLTQDFKLAENPLQLGEIVVTGAGTVSEVEKLGTGRSTVDSTAIQRSNEYNVVNALAAKAPNVNVTSASGEPGASSQIQIRGPTTITASDGQPLIVV